MKEMGQISFENLQKKVNGKTPKETIQIIQEDLDRYKGWKYHEDGNDYAGRLYEYDYYEKAQALLNEFENIDPIAYNKDLNWYFNTDNIPNQDAVFATEQFLNNERKGVFDPLYFFNLLFRQMDELKDSLDKPFDYINHLKSLPINDKQQHLLLGMILYWHGGYPVNNLNPKFNTILKLVEREFLAMFPNTETLEKQFCAGDKETKRKLKDLGANLSAAGFNVIDPEEKKSDKSKAFPESSYINKVTIDFEDLPHYIVQKGIIEKFERGNFSRESTYQEWKTNYLSFLETIPSDHTVKAIKKGIEYGKKIYKYHLDNECTQTDTCRLNQSWDRRIAMAEKILEESENADKEIPPSEIVEKVTPKNKAFTTTRQVLAVKYLMKYANVKVTNDKAVARFIEFLTGKNHDNIYKLWRQPYKDNFNEMREDLRFVRKYFEDLEATEIVKMISNDIDNPL